MHIYKHLISAQAKKKKQLAILIDPDKFEGEEAFAKAYVNKLPATATHLFVGGSTDRNRKTHQVVTVLKKYSRLPVILFPGSYEQITQAADGILFLSLLSGRNPDYLVEQQLAAVPFLNKAAIEVISTGYVLLNGGITSSVERVSGTPPIPQSDIAKIVHTAQLAQYFDMKCVYLEAGSGATVPVKPEVIEVVRAAIDIPLIVGGGIRLQSQLQTAYNSGADLVVIGTAFEEDSWEE